MKPELPPEQLAAASSLTAYRVRVFFDVVGAGFDVGEHCCRRATAGDFGDGDEEEATARLALESEVVAELGSFFGHLKRLGCINAGVDGDGGDAHYLIVSDDWTPPIAPFPWDPQGSPEMLLGRIVGTELRAVPGVTLDAFALVERTSVDGAFRALSGLQTDHQLGDWGGERTIERHPKPHENLEQWGSRVAVPAHYMGRLSTRLTLYDFDMDLAFALPAPNVAEKPEFAVDGWLPFRETAMIVAPPGIGKSTFCHQLLAVLTEPASGSKSFLGRNVSGQFMGAVLSGEETEEAWAYRANRYEKLWPNHEPMLFIVQRSGFLPALRALAAKLRKLKDRRLGVLVIDSVSAFIEGDDTKSSVASEFHQVLREWSLETGWAVVMVHHTTKAPAQSLASYIKSVKGSSTHVQMPRNVFAMIDRGAGFVEFGTIKSNLPQEFAWLPVGTGCLLRKDSQTYTFEAVTATERGDTAASGSDIERIFQAVREMNAAGRAVQRTGPAGLFAQRLASLAGLSRSFMDQATASLIASGRLEKAASGLVAVENGHPSEPDS